MRSPTLLLIRMKAAETSASSAIADWTPLAVVSRSLTTAEIETFISDVSTTSTNIAMASSRANRELRCSCPGARVLACLLTGPPRQMLSWQGTGRPPPQRVSGPRPVRTMTGGPALPSVENLLGAGGVAGS